MKQIPILFSYPMVYAIMDDLKTQTRREVKSRSTEMTALLINLYAGADVDRCLKEIMIHSPYNIGDVLWVREEHYRWGYWEKNGKTATGRQKWKFCATIDEIVYRDAVDSRKLQIKKNSQRSIGWYKRLARFMPKTACRTYLEITNVRIERLASISDADAIAEGIHREPSYEPDDVAYTDYRTGNYFYSFSEYSYDYGNEIHSAPVASYCTLWDEINGENAWKLNPFVWVIEFKRKDMTHASPIL